MNQKQLTLLLVLGLLAGGLGVYLYQKKTATWQATDNAARQTLLGAFNVNDVTQIVIKQADKELNLAKQDIWKVKERSDYPANFSEISEFIRKFSELKAAQSIKVGPSQMGRLELVPPGKGANSGTLVEFKDKGGKVLKSVLLGKKHLRKSGEEESPMFGRGGGDGWPDGRYLSLPGANPPTVWVITDALANAEPKPEQWLNKDFFKVEKLRSVSVTPTNAAQAWKMTRETETGEMKLADKKDSEDLDTAKVSSLAQAFSFPSFNDVASPDAKPEVTGLDKPATVHLETFEDLVYDIKIGKPGEGDNYHLTVAVSANLPKERTPGKDEKPEDKAKLDKEFQEKIDKLKARVDQEKALEKWVYLVSKWTVDPVLKDRSQLMAEKKTEAAATSNTIQVPALEADADAEETKPEAADKPKVSAVPRTTVTPPVPPTFPKPETKPAEEKK